MNAPEPPPAPQKMLLFRALVAFVESLRTAVMLHLAQDFALQRFDESRNRNEHGNALVANHVNQVGRLQRIAEDQGARQKRRNEYSQHLAEHVAQRKQIQETQRMKKSLVAKIFLDLTLDRFDIGKHVAVRDHHAARLGRGARSEDDLQRIWARESRRRVGRRIALRGELRKRFQDDKISSQASIRKRAAAKN